MALTSDWCHLIICKKKIIFCSHTQVFSFGKTHSVVSESLHCSCLFSWWRNLKVRRKKFSCKINYKHARILSFKKRYTTWSLHILHIICHKLIEEYRVININNNKWSWILHNAIIQRENCKLISDSSQPSDERLHCLRIFKQTAQHIKCVIS